MTDTFTGLAADALFFSYDKKNFSIEDISTYLKPGCFYGLIGPNGSGKSTLLDLLCGYILPVSGRILLNGKTITTYRRSEIATLLTYVPQSFSLSFDYSVEDVVMMGRHIHIPRFSSPGKTDFKLVSGAIDQMGIYHLRHRKVTRLSGGEKQRVMIARALAQNTDLVLLDEVTSNLDINHAISIMTTMSDLVKKQGKTVVAAMHDLNMAAAFCDILLVMKEGKMVHFGPAATVMTEKLIQDLYHVRSEITMIDNGKKYIRFSYS